MRRGVFRGLMRAFICMLENNIRTDPSIIGGQGCFYRGLVSEGGGGGGREREREKQNSVSPRLELEFEKMPI